MLFFQKKFELKDFYSAFLQIDEIFVEMRKDIPQTQYVFFVSDEEIFYDPKKDTFVSAPLEIQGYWIQKYPDDNTLLSLKDRLGIDNDSYQVEFVKAKKVQITVDTFEAL